MTISKLLARQLGNPSGVPGKFAAFLWNRRNAALNDAVFDMLALEPADRVLEIGFGGGYLLGRMSSIVTDGLLAGVDISSAMVAHCANRFRNRIRDGKLELECAAAESLPYPSRYFTKVCSVNSIFYWGDVGCAFSEIERVLRPGGNFVVCFTSKASLEKKNFARNIRLLEVDEIQELMVANGIRCVRTQYSADRHRTFICMEGTVAAPDAGGDAMTS